MDKAVLFKQLAGKNVPLDLPVIGKVFCVAADLELAEEYRNLVNSDAGVPAVFEWLMINLLCDENGTPLFTQEDGPALRKTEVDVALDIFKAIMAVSNLVGTEKNLPTTES